MRCLSVYCDTFSLTSLSLSSPFLSLSLFSFHRIYHDPVTQSQSQVSMRRQRLWPWTALMTLVRVVVICSGINSLPVGRWFSLFSKNLINHRKKWVIISLWTSRGKKKINYSVSWTQTPNWRMLQCISVLSQDTMRWATRRGWQKS